MLGWQDQTLWIRAMGDAGGYFECKYLEVSHSFRGQKLRVFDHGIRGSVFVVGHET